MALAVVVAQAGGEAAPAVEAPATEAAPVMTAEERAAVAAEKAAAAAQKAAEAAARIADAVAPLPAAEKKKEEKKADRWTGSVGAGLTFITGNSQTLTLTGTAAADRTWDSWALGIRLSGAYGLANPAANVSNSSSAVTARRALGTIRGDRSFGAGLVSLFALGGVEFDHMKNIESRSIGEAGTGLTFFNRKEGDLEKFYLRLDLAMRGGFETRFQYFPVEAPIDGDYGIIILAPRAAVTMRWNLTRDVRLSEELEAIPFVLAPAAGRLLINNTTKLNTRLTESVSLATALVVNFDSQPPQSAPPPAPQRLTTDVALTVGVEAAF
jgi:putative salt-induced outer membrane protein YdiY